MQKSGEKIQGRARVKAMGWQLAWHIHVESHQSWQRVGVRSRDWGGDGVVWGQIMLNFEG